MYFVEGIRKLVHDVGGRDDDFKERPVVALIQSEVDPTIYWAIPVGDVEHREVEALDRIEKFIDYPEDDVRRYYYHIGNTNRKSIFFVSGVVPVTPAYINREYMVDYTHHYIIKNKQLLADLNYKLKRILAFEISMIKSTGKFYFEQNIFGIYGVMLGENKTFNEIHGAKSNNEKEDVVKTIQELKERIAQLEEGFR